MHFCIFHDNIYLAGHDVFAIQLELVRSSGIHNNNVGLRLFRLKRLPNKCNVK
uniref:Uncharacterized protein n=1 Tax=Anguilla anguilla TaxID=7936 RepID=A0A0E9XDT5_ANGAN